MLTPIPDAPSPPTPISQPGPDFVSQQQADLTADLLVTVARLQSEDRTLKLASLAPPKPTTWAQPARCRSIAFTDMEVLKLREITSWNQYRQVFDAIVRSNGWDYYTVALQLLSHLEGDALNVALLVPETQRATRIGLVSALNDHYGLPG